MCSHSLTAPGPPVRAFHPPDTPQDVSLYQTPSLVLRFAMVCFFMLAPTLLQWGLKKMVIHHLDEHPLGMFVDLCYVANVSVFIFDDEYRRAIVTRCGCICLLFLCGFVCVLRAVCADGWVRVWVRVCGCAVGTTSTGSAPT